MPNQDWLHRVFHAYESKLVHYAWSIIGDMDAARDIAQDTFLKLCRETPATVGDPPNAWLYKICRNRAIDYYRHRQRHVMVSVEPDDEALADDRAPADGDLIHREDRAAVLKALSALPEREQEIVRLKFLHDFSYKQIAETVGLSAGNVGYILHGALVKLREQVADGDGENSKFQTPNSKQIPNSKSQIPKNSSRLCVLARDFLNLFSTPTLTGATV